MSRSADASATGVGIPYSILYGEKPIPRLKYRMYGLVELVYKNYTVDATVRGKKKSTGWTSFSQRYKLGVMGYVYSPKLLFIDASIGLDRENTSIKKGDDDWTSNNITYSVSAIFLQYRPITLTLEASRTIYNSEGQASLKNDSSSSFYSARLVSTYRKLPTFRIEYSHWDYSADRMTGQRFFDEFTGQYYVVKKQVEDKTSSNKLDVFVNGVIDKIRTRYALSLGFSTFSTANRSYDSSYIRSGTTTNLGKDNILWTYFQYTKIDTSKLLDLSTTFKPSPFKKIYHSYYFEYINSESGDSKTNSYTFSGLWRYRLSNRIHAKADFRYRYGTTDDDADTSYKMNTALNYGRPLKAFDFNAQYSFFVGQEKREDEFTFMENRLDLNLSTRRLTWGRLYSHYDILYHTFQSNQHVTDDFDNVSVQSKDSDEIQQRLKIGAKIKGPFRASWSAELEARYLNSSMSSDGAWRSVWFGDNQWAEEIRHYTARGDLRYPVGRRGSVSFAGSYTTGTTNSRPIRKYDYEGRFNYSIFRDLRFTGWWRVEWRSKGWWNAGLLNNVNSDFASDTRTRDYEFDLYYAWRRLYFSVEYASTKLDEGSTSTESKRFYLKVSRPF